MSRKNYYEILTSLHFDNKMDTDIKVKEAIATWKENITLNYNKETDPVIKDNIKQEMELEMDMKRVMLDAKLRKNEALQMKAIKLKELESYIEILKMNRGNESLFITNARLRSIVHDFRLTSQTVIQQLKKNKIEIVTPQQTIKYNDLFLDKVHEDELSQNIIQANQRSILQRIGWLSPFTNLYEFLACYDNHPNINYQNRHREDLLAIASKGSLEYATDNSLEGHLIQNIFSTAKNNIFNNSINTQKYNNSLKLESLSELFKLLANISVEMKKDEIFAENVIKKIRKEFPDYEIARAIYNYKSGLLKDPYEKHDFSIEMYCHNCHSLETFSTLQEAKRSNCKVCGEPLFIKCPNCGKLIPSSSKQCQFCHFSCQEASYFDLYYQLSLQALEDMNFSEAKKMMIKAKIANPKEERVKVLEKKIQSQITKFKFPLDKLNHLIQEKKYVEASKYIYELKIKYPQLHLKKEEELILKTLENIRYKFSHKSFQKYEGANTCVEILREVKDYTPAKEYLITVPPHPSRSFQAHYIQSQKGVVLDFQPVTDLGVKYVIIRKENEEPKNINDGKKIFSSQSTLEYIDTSVESGIQYFYALFVKRGSTISSPMTTSIIVCRDIDINTFHCFEDSHQCSFSWRLPKNAKGVRVLRSERNVSFKPDKYTKEVANNVIQYYEDHDVINGKIYEYRLQVIYYINNAIHYSRGIVKQMMPNAIALKTVIQNATYLNGEITLTLSSQDNYVQILALKKDFVKEDTVLDSSTLHQYGVVLTTVKGQTEVRIRVPKNKVYNLTAVTISGLKAIAGNVVSISSYEKYEIDKLKTKINNSRLYIHIKEPLNNDVTNFYYSVCTKKSSNEKPPFLTREDIHKMNKISFNTYQKDGAIIVEHISEKELYITVIAQMRNGKQIFYTEPSKYRINNSPKKIIQYDISWGGIFKNKKEKAILKINCFDCQDELPELYLVGSKSGAVPTGYRGNDILTICHLPSSQQSSQQILLSMDRLKLLPNQAKLRLYMNKEDQEEFEAQPVSVKNLIVPIK